jgi:hypothetical protein
MKVPWLTKKTIAAAVTGVIADYEAKIKRRVQPPIPVENIIERGLSLKLGFTDLRKKLKLDDVLGATYVEEGMICVDRSLAENQNEGRLCFTFPRDRALGVAPGAGRSGLPNRWGARLHFLPDQRRQKTD